MATPKWFLVALSQCPAGQIAAADPSAFLADDEDEDDDYDVDDLDDDCDISDCAEHKSRSQTRVQRVVPFQESSTFAGLAGENVDDGKSDDWFGWWHASQPCQALRG